MDSQAPLVSNNNHTKILWNAWLNRWWLWQIRYWVWDNPRCTMVTFTPCWDADTVDDPSDSYGTRPETIRTAMWYAFQVNKRFNKPKRNNDNEYEHNASAIISFVYFLHSCTLVNLLIFHFCFLVLYIFCTTHFLCCPRVVPLSGETPHQRHRWPPGGDVLCPYAGMSGLVSW